jgi:hypothetical protein
MNATTKSFLVNYSTRLAEPDGPPHRYGEAVSANDGQAPPAVSANDLKRQLDQLAADAADTSRALQATHGGAR